MTFKLPDLPYDPRSLVPVISEETLNIHHGRHHAGYVKKLNAAIDGTDFEGCRLDEVAIKALARTETGIFRNAAQAWNHEFYWQEHAAARRNGAGKRLGRGA